MKHSFQGKYKNSYLTKLFYDSSPNFEDIKNYYNCYSNLYNEEDKDILENITFIIIKYKDKKYNNHTEYENSFNSFCKVFGACIPQGCKDQEYYEILNHINNDNNYHLIDGNIDGVVNLKSVKNYSFIKKISQLLIPLLMIIFIILVFEIKHISGLLWSLFGYFFNKFHKNHFGEENIKKILKINKLNQIEKLNGFIKLNNNIEEVMPGSKESQISNEDGSLTIYARGTDAAGNVKEVSDKIYTLDLDMIEKPVIIAKSGYPILTESGVRFDDTLTVTYDRKIGIKNEMDPLNNQYNH